MFTHAWASEKVLLRIVCNSVEKLISNKKLQLLLTKIHSKLPKGAEYVLGKDLVLCTFQAGGH